MPPPDQAGAEAGPYIGHMVQVNPFARLAAQTPALATWLRWLLLALLASLPFELDRGLALGGLTFTNLELLLLACLALWGLLLGSQRRLPSLPGWLIVPSLGFVAALLLSALLAEAWRTEALKFCARQIQGLLLCWCVADQLADGGWPLARQFALALLAGASLSALLGLLELAELPPLLAMLDAFKIQPTLAGGLLRLSASFAYANIAAMYFAALLPLALLGFGLATGRRAWLAATAALLLYLAALLTYSRAALLTTTAMVLITPLASWALVNQSDTYSALPRSPRRLRSTIRCQKDLRALCGEIFVARSVWRVAGLSAGLLASAMALLLFNPGFQARITAPEVERWYRASYQAAPLPTIAPNALVRVSVTVLNAGQVAWHPTSLRPVALSYHWLAAETRLVVRYNGHRTPLPGSIAPGQAVTLDALVQAPRQPGRYLLAWDLVVEQSGWFSERGNPLAEVAVTVAGTPVDSQPAPAAELPGTPRQLTTTPPPPARQALWDAALRLWHTSPWRGIGPDVFRHVYGPLLGLQAWDDRIHTNNLYLELLVGAGVLGLAAFGALGVAVALAGARLVRQAAIAQRWMALGCLLALGCFLLHGTLDMFLEYSATYVLAWGLLGGLAGAGGERVRLATENTENTEVAVTFL